MNMPNPLPLPKPSYLTCASFLLCLLTLDRELSRYISTSSILARVSEQIRIKNMKVQVQKCKKHFYNPFWISKKGKISLSGFLEFRKSFSLSLRLCGKGAGACPGRGIGGNFPPRDPSRSYQGLGIHREPCTLPLQIASKNFLLFPAVGRSCTSNLQGSPLFLRLSDPSMTWQGKERRKMAHSPAVTQSWWSCCFPCFPHFSCIFKLGDLYMNGGCDLFE